MVEPYPKGTKVIIRTFQEMPDGWNGHMFDELMGKTAVIRSSPHRVRDVRSYNYKLDRWEWSWRHTDLIPINGGKLEPNTAFRIKKYENR